MFPAVIPFNSESRQLIFELSFGKKVYLLFLIFLKIGGHGKIGRRFSQKGPAPGNIFNAR